MRFEWARRSVAAEWKRRHEAYCRLIEKALKIKISAELLWWEEISSVVILRDYVEDTLTRLCIDMANPDNWNFSILKSLRAINLPSSSQWFQVPTRLATRLENCKMINSNNVQHQQLERIKNPPYEERNILDDFFSPFSVDSIFSRSDLFVWIAQKVSAAEREKKERKLSDDECARAMLDEIGERLH